MSELKQLIQPAPWSFFFGQAVYFILIGYIGYYAAKRVNNLHDFYVMGGKAGAIVGGFAYFATKYSMSTFMGVPSITYATGFAGMSISIPGLAFSMLMPCLLIGRKLMLMGRKYGFLTMTDYLSDRFDSQGIRALHASICVVFLVVMIGVQTVGTGIIFHAFTGFPEWVGIIGMGVVVVLYCSTGGMRSAMITDVLQGGLMLCTATLTFVVSLKAGGGFEAICQKLAGLDSGYLTHPGVMNNFPWKKYFSVILILSFVSVANPVLFTKFFTMKNYRVMWKAVILGTVGMLITGTLIEWAGVNAIVTLPGLSGKQTDFIVPMLLQQTMHPLVASLLVSGIVSAGMSTIDALMVVATGAVSHDIYKNLINPKATSQQVLKLSFYVTVILGAVGVIIGIVKPATIFELARFALGGLCVWAAPVVFGMYWRRTTKAAVFASVIIGEIIYIALRLYPELSFGFDPIVENCFYVILILYTVSLFTKPSEEAVLKRHFDDLVIPSTPSKAQHVVKERSEAFAQAA